MHYVLSFNSASRAVSWMKHVLFVDLSRSFDVIGISGAATTERTGGARKVFTVRADGSSPVTANATAAANFVRKAALRC